MEGIKSEIKDFSQSNENEGTTYSNLQDTMKVVIRRTFMALSGFIKKSQTTYTSNLIAYLVTLEQIDYTEEE